MKELRTSRSAQASSSCRSRGARARARSEPFSGDPSRLVSGFAPPPRPLGSSGRSRSRAILPRLACTRRSLVRRARRARSPPRCVCSTPRGAQRFALRLPCTRGARLGGDPGPFDRCLLLTDSIFKDETPSLDARRTARPHAMRELSVHAAEPTSASRPTVAERCLLRPPFCRRTSDAPSPRGLPRRSAAASTGVGPRTRMLFRARDLRVEPEGLDRRHQAA